MTKSSPSIWHYVVSVKSTVKILPIFVAFIENTNFNFLLLYLTLRRTDTVIILMTGVQIVIIIPVIVCLSNAWTHSIDWYFLLHLSLCWASFCLINLHYFVRVVVNRVSNKKEKRGQNLLCIKFYVKSINFFL